MRIKVTGVSISKKGKVWIQAESLDKEIPHTDTVFECSEVKEEKEEEEKEKC